MKVVILSTLVVVLYLAEYLSPLRKRKFDKEAALHGVNNLMIVIVSSICLKLFSVFVIYLGIDYFSSGPQILLQLDIPSSLKSVLGIILFDFLIWFQHLLSHRVPLFWRFHRIHHSDPFLDTSSALRFHPIEIIASMFYKIVLILLIGITQEDFLIFELLLTGFALFNHSNIHIPRHVDKVLGFIIVTPTTHQVHHSKKRSETNSNYGFNIVIWDKIFKTYNDYYKLKEELEIGLDEIKDSKTNSLSFLLGWPLRRD